MERRQLLGLPPSVGLAKEPGEEAPDDVRLLLRSGDGRLSVTAAPGAEGRFAGEPTIIQVIARFAEPAALGTVGSEDPTTGPTEPGKTLPLPSTLRAVH